MARKHNVRFDGSVAQLELTREQLEEITSELLERTMEITERTIATARDKGVERVRRRAAGRRHDHHAGDRPDAQGAVRAGGRGSRTRTWPWPRAPRCSP